MDRQAFTQTFNQRPAVFLTGMAIAAAFILALIYFDYFALTNSHSDRQSMRTGVPCTNWSYESPVEKHLNGPDVQQTCQRYFAARSTDDAQRDDAVWQHKVDAANAAWEAR